MNPHHDLNIALKHNPFKSWFSVLFIMTQSSRFWNSTGVWKYFEHNIFQSITTITRIGCHWSWHSPWGLCFSQFFFWSSRHFTASYSTLAGFDAFLAHCADPFRNSAETTDTSLDCRCSPDLLLHVDLLASSLRFWSPFPSSSAPGGCQSWLKGLPGGFKGPFNPSSRS